MLVVSCVTWESRWGLLPMAAGAGRDQALIGLSVEPRLIASSVLAKTLVRCELTSGRCGGGGGVSKTSPWIWESMLRQKFSVRYMGGCWRLEFVLDFR